MRECGAAVHSGQAFRGISIRAPNLYERAPFSLSADRAGTQWDAQKTRTVKNSGTARRASRSGCSLRGGDRALGGLPILASQDGCTNCSSGCSCWRAWLELVRQDLAGWLLMIRCLPTIKESTIYNEAGLSIRNSHGFAN